MKAIVMGFSEDSVRDSIEQILQIDSDRMSLFLALNLFPDEDDLEVGISMSYCLGPTSAIVQFKIHKREEPRFQRVFTGVMNFDPQKKLCIYFVDFLLDKENSIKIDQRCRQAWSHQQKAFKAIPSFDLAKTFTTSGPVVKVINKFFIIFDGFEDLPKQVLIGQSTFVPSVYGEKWWMPYKLST